MFFFNLKHEEVCKCEERLLNRVRQPMYIESDLLILERVTNWIESELILLYKSEHGNECFITLHCS